MMKKNNYNLGGEQSGHIILGRFATTGDGLLVALETLFALRKGKLASEILKVYKPVPQKLLNIQVKDKKIINTPKCKKAIKLAKKLIRNEGRLLVRPSGTEPKVRIMCESFNQTLMIKCINLIKKTIH
jgi:phosphoglucosamine mutase